MILPSDQLIQDTEGFHSVMKDALKVATETEGLVTVGIKPSWACPSYGYVERGSPTDLAGLKLTHQPHEVVRFREKPDPERAAEYLASGNFTWNAGMFIWSVPAVLRELGAHAAELRDFVEELRDSSDLPGTVTSRFPSLTPISIDYALMEKAENIVMAKGTFPWDDVGSWTALSNHFAPDSGGNIVIGSMEAVASRDNIVFSRDRTTAMIGVKDLIVVQAEGVTLICPKDRAQDIKGLLQQIRENPEHHDIV